jgi:F-type H+-transporting ATPase subunit b
MENLLTPDKGLMFWTIISFLALVFVLAKFAWKPLLMALRDREMGIRQAIDDAANAKLTADQLKARYEAELAKGQFKVQEILDQAKADAQRVRDQLLNESQEESRRMVSQTRRQLEEDKAKISRELRQEMAGISVKAAEKLLRHAMNAKEQDALLQEFFKDLEKGM